MELFAQLFALIESTTWTAIIALVLGLALLMFSADRFIAGSASAARSLGVPVLIIGLIVVGFGTSMPEIFVSAVAALAGERDLGIGNAIGSNITNIALIIGLTALMAVIPVRSAIVRKEFLLMLVVTFGAFVLFLDNQLTTLDGLILMLGLAGVLGFLLWDAITNKNDILEAEAQEALENPMPLPVAVIWILVGGTLLIFSANILVTGASKIAVDLGVSELVIGLTIVAVGTSLPELAAALAAAFRKEPDLVVGNIIGSNIFNSLAVVAMPALFAPGPLNPAIIWRDYPLSLVLVVLFFVFAWVFKCINRVHGALFLLIFVAYTIYLYASNMIKLPVA
jgi:cation:H+ antiporter